MDSILRLVGSVLLLGAVRSADVKLLRSGPTSDSDIRARLFDADYLDQVFEQTENIGELPGPRVDGDIAIYPSDSADYHLQELGSDGESLTKIPPQVPLGQPESNSRGVYFQEPNGHSAVGSPDYGSDPEMLLPMNNNIQVPYGHIVSGVGDHRSEEYIGRNKHIYGKELGNVIGGNSLINPTAASQEILKIRHSSFGPQREDNNKFAPNSVPQIRASVEPNVVQNKLKLNPGYSGDNSWKQPSYGQWQKDIKPQGQYINSPENTPNYFVRGHVLNPSLTEAAGQFRRRNKNLWPPYGTSAGKSKAPFSSEDVNTNDAHSATPYVSNGYYKKQPVDMKSGGIDRDFFMGSMDVSNRQRLKPFHKPAMNEEQLQTGSNAFGKIGVLNKSARPQYEHILDNSNPELQRGNSHVMSNGVNRKPDLFAAQDASALYRDNDEGRNMQLTPPSEDLVKYVQHSETNTAQISPAGMLSEEVKTVKNPHLTNLQIGKQYFGRTNDLVSPLEKHPREKSIVGGFRPNANVLKNKSTTLKPQEERRGIEKPLVQSWRMRTEIRFRYAVTIVSSEVVNPSGIAQETVFNVLIPDRAFISGFLIEADGKVYNSHFKEKDDTREGRRRKNETGKQAPFIKLSARDAKKFTVQLELQPYEKATFNLTYEELLERRLGFYEFVANIYPGQIAEDFSLKILLKETQPLRMLKFPALLHAYDHHEKNSVNDLVRVRSVKHGGQEYDIVYSLTPEEQRLVAGDSVEGGVDGQFVMQYDINRESVAEAVVVGDYFVHYFSPVGLKPLPRHVTLVVDLSRSMNGRKLDQIKDAMVYLLDTLRQGDFFSLVKYSTHVVHWDPDIPYVDSGVYPYPCPNEDTYERIHPASPEIIRKAKYYIMSLRPEGGNNIQDALLYGLRHAQISHDQKSRLHTRRRLLMSCLVLVTDGGLISGNDTSYEQIINSVVEANARSRVPIHTVSFGLGADYRFLSMLSSKNYGFARKIYEASDADDQLKDFFMEVLSPVLSNVSFNYPDIHAVDQESLTEHTFSSVLEGSELVVAGRMREIANSDLTAFVSGTSYKGYADYGTEIANIAKSLIEPPIFCRRDQDPSRDNFLERIWAYLTINQLLRKLFAWDDFSGSDDGEGEGMAIEQRTLAKESPKDKATRLALEYSFATPVTTLVIVKPYEVTTQERELQQEFDKLQPGGIRNKNIPRKNPAYTMDPSYLVVQPQSFSGQPGKPENTRIGFELQNGGPQKYMKPHNPCKKSVDKFERGTGQSREITEQTQGDGVPRNHSNTKYLLQDYGSGTKTQKIEKSREGKYDLLQANPSQSGSLRSIITTPTRTKGSRSRTSGPRLSESSMGYSNESTMQDHPPNYYGNHPVQRPPSATVNHYVSGEGTRGVASTMSRANTGRNFPGTIRVMGTTSININQPNTKKSSAKQAPVARGLFEPGDGKSQESIHGIRNVQSDALSAIGSDDRIVENEERESKTTAESKDSEYAPRQKDAVRLQSMSENVGELFEDSPLTAKPSKYISYSSPDANEVGGSIKTYNNNVESFSKSKKGEDLESTARKYHGAISKTTPESELNIEVTTTRTMSTLLEEISKPSTNQVPTDNSRHAETLTNGILKEQEKSKIVNNGIDEYSQADISSEMGSTSTKHSDPGTGLESKMTNQRLKAHTNMLKQGIDQYTTTKGSIILNEIEEGISTEKAPNSTSREFGVDTNINKESIEFNRKKGEALKSEDTVEHFKLVTQTIGSVRKGAKPDTGSSAQAIGTAVSTTKEKNWETEPDAEVSQPSSNVRIYGDYQDNLQESQYQGNKQQASQYEQHEGAGSELDLGYENEGSLKERNELYPLPQINNDPLSLITMEELKWLSTFTLGNGILLPTGFEGATELLDIDFHAPSMGYYDCATPLDDPGQCRHLPHCVLRVFSEDVADYLKYFCRIENYAGVCCPNSVSLPIRR